MVPLDIDALLVSSSDVSWEQQQQQQQQMMLVQRGDRDTPSKKQLTLDELYMQLQAAQSWPGCLDRRRTLAAATAAAATAAAGAPGAAAAAAAAARLPRELHLCLLPGHFRLYSRIINTSALPTQQQQQLQQLLLPSPVPAAASLNASPPPLPSTVFTYICLVFSRQVERIGCVLGHIAACSPEGRPHTVADLKRDLLARLSPSTLHMLRQDFLNSSSSSSSTTTSSSSGSSTVHSNRNAAATQSAAATAAAAAANEDKTEAKGMQEELGPLRLSISDCAHLLRIPMTEEISWLTHYASACGSAAVAAAVAVAVTVVAAAVGVAVTAVAAAVGVAAVGVTAAAVTAVAAAVRVAVGAADAAAVGVAAAVGAAAASVAWPAVLHARGGALFVFAAAPTRSREGISNLLAVPFRLEADYTPEEKELIRTGARQVSRTRR